MKEIVEDLRSAWDSAAERMRSAEGLLILTDFDGTLVPLAPLPDLVILSQSAHNLLEDLASRPKVSLGIVSGRALTDLVSRVGVEGIWYVGNHGFEIRSPSGREAKYYEPGDIAILDPIAQDLARATRGITGVHLENKGPILALHYRRVEPDLIPEVERIFLDILVSYHDRVTMARGKLVLEARLRAPCTKGSAVRHLRREVSRKMFPIYFGDDLSDHDAFRELRNVGLTVSVGDGHPPLAHYTLPDSMAVLEVLGRIGRLLTEGVASTD